MMKRATIVVAELLGLARTHGCEKHGCEKHRCEKHRCEKHGRGMGMEERLRGSGALLASRACARANPNITAPLRDVDSGSAQFSANGMSRFVESFTEHTTLDAGGDKLHHMPMAVVGSCRLSGVTSPDGSKA